MTVATPQSIRPSLWRTCRILANRPRLKILGLLLARPDQTVSAVASSLKIPVPMASLYLRALNARGLLDARRTGRCVRYRPAPAPSIPEAKTLLEGLKSTFAEENDPVQVIFRLATAFTHPRRIEVVYALQEASLTFRGLAEKTGISRRALKRHLRKLVVRGFVVHDKGVYRLAVPRGPFAKSLREVACVV